MLSLFLFTRIVIIVTVVIAITDAVVFYHLQKCGMKCLTWQFVALVIAVTIIPIVINLWYHLIFRAA
jgi:hypothetical protein